MEQQVRGVPIPMDHLVVVRPEPRGQYTARVVHYPEVRAVAATEDEAVEQVKRALEEWLAGARFAFVKVPTPPLPPLSPVQRIDPNDPLEQEYLAELARMRREDLEQTLREYGEECPSSSSTPAT